MNVLVLNVYRKYCRANILRIVAIHYFTICSLLKNVDLMGKKKKKKRKFCRERKNEEMKYICL